MKAEAGNRIFFIKLKLIVRKRSLYIRNRSLFHEIEIYFIQSKSIY